MKQTHKKKFSNVSDILLGLPGLGKGLNRFNRTLMGCFRGHLVGQIEGGHILGDFVPLMIHGRVCHEKDICFSSSFIRSLN